MTGVQAPAPTVSAIGRPTGTTSFVQTGAAVSNMISTCRSADLYKLRIEGTQHVSFNQSDTCTLVLTLDGQSLGRQNLTIKPGVVSAVECWTPYIPARSAHPADILGQCPKLHRPRIGCVACADRAGSG